MAKITRVNGNVKAFGSSQESGERTVFGQTGVSNDLTAQFTPEFLRGWGIVGASDFPKLQDFNAATYTNGQLLAYLHQMGIAEYNSAQEFYLNSVTQYNGQIYMSIQDGNTGRQPNTNPAWWRPVTAPATETVSGLAKVATQAQVDAGTDDTTIATPKKMKAAAYIVEKITGERCKLAGFTAGGTIPYMQRDDVATFLLATRQNTVMEGDTVAPDSSAGASNERVANTRFVTQAIAASVIANPPIGVGQSWQDMTASRAKAVTYTNNTGRPIDVFIAFDPSGGASVLTITGHPFSVADNNGTFVSMIIPAGGTYSLSDWGIASPMKWLELR